MITKGNVAVFRATWQKESPRPHNARYIDGVHLTFVSMVSRIKEDALALLIAAD